MDVTHPHTMMWCSDPAAFILAFRGTPRHYPQIENMAIINTRPQWLRWYSFPYKQSSPPYLF
ncbi:MAG: hypothetical protein WA151_06555 [Desulfatirhabdiaceae bacterium]